MKNVRPAFEVWEKLKKVSHRGIIRSSATWSLT
jgi:hypothetical protein